MDKPKENTRLCLPRWTYIYLVFATVCWGIFTILQMVMILGGNLPRYSVFPFGIPAVLGLLAGCAVVFGRKPAAGIKR